MADFNSRKYVEAKGLKGLTQEAHYNVPIDHQSEDSGSGAMGFPLFCALKKTLSNEFEESSSGKKRPLFF
jgi:hypothetical protein